MGAVEAQRLSTRLRSKTLEVVGSNPTGCWAIFLFFFLFLLHQWSVLNQVPQGGASLASCCERKKWMLSCAAWDETGSINSDWIKRYFFAESK